MLLRLWFFFIINNCCLGESPSLEGDFTWPVISGFLKFRFSHVWFALQKRFSGKWDVGKHLQPIISLRILEKGLITASLLSSQICQILSKILTLTFRKSESSLADQSQAALSHARTYPLIWRATESITSKIHFLKAN